MVWPLIRGHVYRIKIQADDPAKKGQMIDKYVVILQGRKEFQGRVRTTVVLATTTLSAQGKPWNVLVPKGTVKFWPEDTLITCLDVYALPVAEIKAGSLVGMLPDPVMADVAVALAVSLEL